MASPEQSLDQINEAFCDAFKVAGLERLVRLKLRRNLYSYASEKDTLPDIVFRLLDAAQREGFLPQLVEEAKKDIPGNEKLAAVFVPVTGDARRRWLGLRPRGWPKVALCGLLVLLLALGWWVTRSPKPTKIGPVNLVWYARERWSGTNCNPGKETQSLVVTGQDPCLLILPSDEVLGNLDLEMAFSIRPNQRSIGWILRAVNSQRYYLFRYTFPFSTGDGAFTGSLVDSGKRLDPPFCEVPLHHKPLRPGHLVHVRANLRGSQVTHEIVYSCWSEVAHCKDLDLDQDHNLLSDRKGSCSLDRRGPPAGLFGLIALGPGDEIELRRLEIIGIQQ